MPADAEAAVRLRPAGPARPRISAEDRRKDDAGGGVLRDSSVCGYTERVSDLPPCPQCKSTFTYEDRASFVCPDCAHEWSATVVAEASEEGGLVVRDAYGVQLADGDSVTLVKDLKVKGAASALKVGTRVKNIRLVDGDHNIDCRIEGFGAMALKSEFVKKG